MTPLHCAAASGHLQCLRLFLKHGADVNAGLVCERTPLYLAVQNGAASCVKELLQHKASPNTPQVGYYRPTFNCISRIVCFFLDF